MTTDPKPPVMAKPKRRRARGSGSVFKIRRTWWISYVAADGRRVKESSGSLRKGDAERLLESRNGSRIHNLPVIKNAEQLTFNEAAQAVIDNLTVNKKRSLVVTTRRITKHLTPYFGGWRVASITTTDVPHMSHTGRSRASSTRKVRGSATSATPRSTENCKRSSAFSISRSNRTGSR